MRKPTSIKRNFITAHPFQAAAGCCAYKKKKFGSVLEKDKIKTIKIPSRNKTKNERSSGAER
jgi:hypothetical protein